MLLLIPPRRSVGKLFSNPPKLPEKVCQHCPRGNLQGEKRRRTASAASNHPSRYISLHDTSTPTRGASVQSPRKRTRREINETARLSSYEEKIARSPHRGRLQRSPRPHVRSNCASSATSPAATPAKVLACQDSRRRAPRPLRAVEGFDPNMNPASAPTPATGSSNRSKRARGEYGENDPHPR